MQKVTSHIWCTQCGEPHDLDLTGRIWTPHMGDWCPELDATRGETVARLPEDWDRTYVAAYHGENQTSYRILPIHCRPVKGVHYALYTRGEQ